MTKNKIFLVLFVNLFMLIKKWKNIKIEFLVILPVFFMFLNNSMMNFHSHIYAEGKIVTHAHPLNHTTGENPSENHNIPNNQIIVFHGFTQDLGDNIQFLEYKDFKATCFSRIICFSDSSYYFTVLRKKQGRSPPLVSV